MNSLALTEQLIDLWNFVEQPCWTGELFELYFGPRMKIDLDFVSAIGSEFVTRFESGFGFGFESESGSESESEIQRMLSELPQQMIGLKSESQQQQKRA